MHVGGTRESGTSTGKDRIASNARAVGHRSAPSFTPIGGIIVGVEFVGGTRDSRAATGIDRSAGGTRTAGHRNTPSFATIRRVAVDIELVGVAG